MEMIFSLFYVFRCPCGLVYVCFGSGKRFFNEGGGKQVEVNRPKACCPKCKTEEPLTKTEWSYI